MDRKNIKILESYTLYKVSPETGTGPKTGITDLSHVTFIILHFINKHRAPSNPQYSQKRNKLFINNNKHSS